MPDWVWGVLAAMPDWIVAVGTAGAFIIAASAFRTSVRDNHVKQARLVRAYLEKSPSSFDFSANGPGSLDTSGMAATYLDDALTSHSGDDDSWYLEDDCVVVSLVLDNRSTDFISDIDVEISRLDGEAVGTILHVDTQPPGTRSPMVAVVPTWPQPWLGVRVRTTFTDAAGNRWTVRHDQPVKPVR